MLEISALGEREAADEAAELPLERVDRLGLGLLLRLALARDLKPVTRGADLEVLLLHARNVGLEQVRILVLGHVEGWGPFRPVERREAPKDGGHLAERIPAEQVADRAQWARLGQLLPVVLLLYDVSHDVLLVKDAHLAGASGEPHAAESWFGMRHRRLRVVGEPGRTDRRAAAPVVGTITSSIVTRSHNPQGWVTDRGPSRIVGTSTPSDHAASGCRRAPRVLRRADPDFEHAIARPQRKCLRHQCTVARSSEPLRSVTGYPHTRARRARAAERLRAAPRRGHRARADREYREAPRRIAQRVRIMPRRCVSAIADVGQHEHASSA